MNESYLIAKCHRCGAVSRVPVSSVRSRWSRCPVCMEGELESRASQIRIELFEELRNGTRYIDYELPDILDRPTN